MTEANRRVWPMFDLAASGTNYARATEAAIEATGDAPLTDAEHMGWLDAPERAALYSGIGTDNYEWRYEAAWLAYLRRVREGK